MHIFGVAPFLSGKTVNQQLNCDKRKCTNPVAAVICSMPVVFLFISSKKGLTPKIRLINVLYCHIKLTFLLNIYCLWMLCGSWTSGSHPRLRFFSFSFLLLLLLSTCDVFSAKMD